MSDFNNDLEDNNGGSNPNIMEALLRDFLPYWPVIFAAAIIGFVSSKVYLRYQRPIHQSVAGILLKNESESTESLLKQAVGKQETKIELEKMGYRIKSRGSIGRTEGILIGPTGKRITVADKRGDDAVAGF